MENRRLSLLYNLQNLYNSSEVGSIEYQLSGYFIDNYLEIEKLNIFDVAEENHVSRATVRRYCNKLGYDNFKKLKQHFNEFDEGLDIYNEFYSRSGFVSVLKQQIFEMFDELEERLSNIELKQIVSAIVLADEVIIIASSTIANSVRFFQQAMALFGKRVSIVVNITEFENRRNSLTADSLVLFFSISGVLAKTMLSVTSDSDAKVFLFTNLRSPLFNQFFDKVYHLTSSENQKPNEIIYYTYGIAFVLDTIINEYSQIKE
ncbi:Transcriptional regulator, RpiR family [Streptococcus gallolyticus]|uniref:Transcriptional regulator, RpiR family n=1 Tax=Streptococcus gallolyticus TaxID=315405 RepID=A0A139NBR9_9STRE|nr:MurR/RpiR family transcriptional regulator [Streptococcus gallolyticus]KXT73257.1 Transcriptional regulator, RpiR family [Streptococcus gallolyticus]